MHRIVKSGQTVKHEGNPVGGFPLYTSLGGVGSLLWIPDGDIPWYGGQRFSATAREAYLGRSNARRRPTSVEQSADQWRSQTFELEKGVLFLYLSLPSTIFPSLSFLLFLSFFVFLVRLLFLSSLFLFRFFHFFSSPFSPSFLLSLLSFPLFKSRIPKVQLKGLRNAMKSKLVRYSFKKWDLLATNNFNPFR